MLGNFISSNWLKDNPGSIESLLARLTSLLFVSFINPPSVEIASSVFFLILNSIDLVFSSSLFLFFGSKYSPTKSFNYSKLSSSSVNYLRLVGIALNLIFFKANCSNAWLQNKISKFLLIISWLVTYLSNKVRRNFLLFSLVWFTMNISLLIFSKHAKTNVVNTM